MANLCDIFGFLNALNLNLQDANINIFEVQEKIEAAIKEINLWVYRAKKSNYEYSSLLTELRNQEKEGNVSDDGVKSVLEGILFSNYTMQKNFYFFSFLGRKCYFPIAYS